MPLGSCGHETPSLGSCVLQCSGVLYGQRRNQCPHNDTYLPANERPTLMAAPVAWTNSGSEWLEQSVCPVPSAGSTRYGANPPSVRLQDAGVSVASPILPRDIYEFAYAQGRKVIAPKRHKRTAFDLGNGPHQPLAPGHPWSLGTSHYNEDVHVPHTHSHQPRYRRS
jgi:hypothetical protein